MVVAHVRVTLKQGILDPQGKTVLHALQNLGVEGIGEVRVGKLIQLSFPDLPLEEARRRCELACEKLLANPVIEEYEIDIQEDGK